MTHLIESSLYQVLWYACIQMGFEPSVEWTFVLGIVPVVIRGGFVEHEFDPTQTEIRVMSSN